MTLPPEMRTFSPAIDSFQEGQGNQDWEHPLELKIGALLGVCLQG
uniref:Uncharacterized protein n=1 Tax=Utricularia reniformis TaxID=192314 RepID=A0A1Y0B1Q7_9LAMI|nr:hypothetical protein AEK19_MT1169 [Utricularia reniformis]ART31382.1 hypothetical protein AEK19_MT1169 [Utricularia reniformis]